MAQARTTTAQQALSDMAVPDYGLTAGTQVLTMDGALPVEYLTPGDRILTRSGVRRLASMEMTRIVNARMVRLAPAVLGSGRPGAELLLPASQPVLIRDWRAKALYGAAQVLVVAGRLCDGEFIKAEIAADVRLFTLKLDGPAVIYAGGLELACEAQPVVA